MLPLWETYKASRPLFAGKLQRCFCAHLMDGVGGLTDSSVDIWFRNEMLSGCLAKSVLCEYLFKVYLVLLSFSVLWVLCKSCSFYFFLKIYFIYWRAVRERRKRAGRASIQWFTPPNASSGQKWASRNTVVWNLFQVSHMCSRGEGLDPCSFAFLGHMQRELDEKWSTWVLTHFPNGRVALEVEA